MDKQRVAVIGPGSWGTALSQVLNDNGHEVRIWGNIAEQINEINDEHTNKRYFKDIVLDEKIKAYHNLEDALKDADAVLFVVPTKVTRLVAKQVAQALDHKVKIMHASKGLEPNTHERISTILEEEIPAELRSEIVVVSGPSHAEEVAKNIPTTVAVSSEDKLVAEKVQDLFFTDRFRVYVNEDLIGVQLGGALKNIIALGAGISDGLGFGDNGKAALMTRGLAEIARLGDAMGASKGTFLGLTGVGDLIVTCTSMHSRNRKCGILIGKGLRAEDAVREIGMAVEGVYTIKSAYMLSKKIGVTMPITEKLYEVLQGTKSAAEAVDDLMRRERNYEQI